MLRIRTTKTGSGNTAVQVCLPKSKRVVVIKHIGTASNEERLSELKKLAGNYIATQKDFPLLSPSFYGQDSGEDFLLHTSNLEILDSKHPFAYEFFDVWYKENGFDILESPILRDLSIARILEPSSKLRAIDFLSNNFGITYPKNKIYDHLSTVSEMKEKVEDVAYKYAVKNYPETFCLVLYDVTTLYFETDNSDKLRRKGCSKDNKNNQPQILIGLMVNKNGYPISFDIFRGNTFEGNTFIPSILNLKRKRGIGDLTIVADAGMLSHKNIGKLVRNGLNYIVGARIGGLKEELLLKITDGLNRTEGVYFQTETEKGTLICDYSSQRANKARSDREKQILKAKFQIRNVSKITRRARFLTTEDKIHFRLNYILIKKDETVEGIKGYYTNLKGVSPNLIISRYKDLWHVEKSFRIAKSDLLARPIYHFKETSIRAHILIVFVALCISKSIELKRNLSVKKVKEMVWKVEDVTFRDSLTKRRLTKRMKMQIPDPKLLYP